MHNYRLGAAWFHPDLWLLSSCYIYWRQAISIMIQELQLKTCSYMEIALSMHVHMHALKLVGHSIELHAYWHCNNQIFMT